MGALKYQEETNLTKHVSIHALENFIEAELAETLHGVANQGWCPSFAQLPDSSLLDRHAEALENASVLGWVYLDPAFYQIQRYNSCVGDSTAEDTPKATEREVLVASEFNSYKSKET